MSDPIRQHVVAVETQLEATRARIEEAGRALVDPAYEAAWLETCASRERKADVTDEGGAIPSAWPRFRFGLSPSENRALWILIAHELCPRSRAALRDLATEHEPDVTLDVLRRVVYGTSANARAWRELSHHGALRAHCLIEPVESCSRVPAHRWTFRVSPRVLALVHGSVTLDEDILPFAQLLAGAASLDDLEVDTNVVRRVSARMLHPSGLTIVCGAHGHGRRSLIAAAAAHQGREILTVDSRRLSRDLAALDRELRLVVRESLMLGRIPVFLHLDEIDDLDTFETRVTIPAFATSRHVLARQWRQPPEQVELPAPSGADRAVLWKRTVPRASTGDAELLADMYPLAPALIARAGRLAVARSDGEVRPEHIEIAVREILDHRLASFGKRLTVSQTWSDVVLPDDQTLAVVELLARIRQRRRVYEDWGFSGKVGRGLGVTALLSGPPGTGKTMCAGLIAKDLGAELYQVDASKLVSKWIGETEKNLGELFDAAEAGNAILLFDEADALFGKRTDVRSSNDRHANEQTNYLLQRLESFTGIAILTTNHETAIDEAFRRRLAVHVRFPIPDIDERERLWRALLPQQAPIDDGIDFAALARKYVMSGGYIRNAVLRAAFLAADSDEAIGAYHLTHGAVLEYEAMGKLPTAR